MFRKVIEFSVEKPKIVMGIIILMVVTSLFQLPKIQVDTDPENMLPQNEAARVFHTSIKREFAIYDFIVLGIVNKDNLKGVFNPETLKKVYEITDKIKQIDGVIGYELMSLSTKDDIEQSGMGAVRFKWLMENPPYTEADAAKIRERAMDNPMFYGTIVSEDGKAVSIFVPIEAKNMSYRISQEIREISAEYEGTEDYYITGLPVANDTFGVQMFIQMGRSAPMAMFVIFLLMLGFFKKIRLVISPLMLAGVTVITTMGLLIGFGFKVHIMVSMIPIFLMPIAVLDSVHILSSFFEKYRESHDRKKAILDTVDELFMPMLFTSLTTTAGFLSLVFAKIPPVQVFGVFVAFGVMLAWLLTMTLIPASIVLMKKEYFENFGAKKEHSEKGLINAVLRITGKISTKYWKLTILGTLILILISGYGITKIVVNDNPVRWFDEDHEIRIADKVLNEHFGGTYTAYLVLDAVDKEGEIFKEPEMLRYVEGLQKDLLSKGNVGKTTSLADVTKKIYYELLGGDKVNNVIPNTKPAIAQCLMSYQNSHKPDDLWHFVTPDYSKMNMWIQLTSGDNMNMTQVKKDVEAYMAENKPPFDLVPGWAGLTYINVVWQDRMVGGMFRNFMGSFVVVFLMMAFLFKSPIRGLISMIPLTVTIVFIYSLLGFFGKDYDMPVAVLSALTLGLSVDFAIHFLQRAREIYAEKGNWEETAKEMAGEPGRAILRNAMIVSIGFVPLLFAPLVPYKTVGMFMFLIMLTSSVGTLLILPAIISAMPELVFKEKK